MPCQHCCESWVSQPPRAHLVRAVHSAASPELLQQGAGHLLPQVLWQLLALLLHMHTQAVSAMSSSA